MEVRRDGTRGNLVSQVRYREPREIRPETGEIQGPKRDQKSRSYKGN